MGLRNSFLFLSALVLPFLLLVSAESENSGVKAEGQELHRRYYPYPPPPLVYPPPPRAWVPPPPVWGPPPPPFWRRPHWRHHFKRRDEVNSHLVSEGENQNLRDWRDHHWDDHDDHDHGHHHHHDRRAAYPPPPPPFRPRPPVWRRPPPPPPPFRPRPPVWGRPPPPPPRRGPHFKSQEEKEAVASQ